MWGLGVAALATPHQRVCNATADTAHPSPSEQGEQMQSPQCERGITHSHFRYGLANADSRARRAHRPNRVPDRLHPHQHTHSPKTTVATRHAQSGVGQTTLHSARRGSLCQGQPPFWRGCSPLIFLPVYPQQGGWVLLSKV